MRRIHLILCATIFLALSSHAFAKWVWRPGKGIQWEDERRAASAEEQFRKAQELFDAGRFSAALDEWYRVISLWEDEAYLKPARWMLAETLFKLELYESACDAYKEYLVHYPDVENRLEAIRRMADTGFMLLGGAKREFIGFKLFGGEGRGLEILREIISDHPFEDFSDDYQYRIATHFFSRKDYENSKYEYLKLTEFYPDSEWAEVSQFQLGMCEYLSFRGPDYDATPLMEAKRRFRIYIDHNPTGTQVDKAKEMLSAISERFAEKWLHVAEFYVRTGKPKPAALYLQRILSDYPDTETAGTAREMLVEIRKDLPAEKPATPQDEQRKD